VRLVAPLVVNYFDYVSTRASEDRWMVAPGCDE
jgi:hypothetical protein